MAIRYLSTTENLQKQPIIDPRDSPPNRSREGQLYYNTNSKGLQLYDGTSWSSVGSPGTVTSVGLSMPTAFSVANSPITGSGTLSVTGAGTSSQVVLGDGTLGPLPTGTVTGTGTTNYLSKFTGSSAIGDSLVFDNGTNVGVGTASPTEKLTVEGRVHVNEGTVNRSIQLRNDGLYISRTADGAYLSRVVGTSNGNQIDLRGQTAINLKISSNLALRVHQSRNIGIGTGAAAPGGRLHVKGSGTTSSTDALLIENSAGTDLFTVRDDGSVYALGSGAVATNTAFGKEAFKSNTTGSLNVAIGAEALELNTTGQENTAVGFQAMENNLTGSDNTALGFKALENNTANENTAVGHESLQDNTTGTFNTAVGSKSLQNNTGSFNTAFGAYALNTNTTGTNNVAVGINSLRLNVSGSTNTAIGREALYSNTASKNTAVGYQASMDNTTGASNTSIGYQASMNNATGSHNTAIGRDSLRNNRTSNNTAVGHESLKNNTTGASNVAVGYQAMLDATTGGFNVAIGSSALSSNTTGSNNTAVGRDTQSGNFSLSVILGRGATADGNNQFVVGSSSYNAGAITTETITADKTWTVKINGTDYKIPIVAA